MSTNAWAAAAQGGTLALADHWGEEWTADEVELVAAFTDDVTDEELALTLGRSLYAIWAMQHKLRTTGFDFDAARRRERARAVVAPPTCPTHHLALTAMGTCDWC